MFDLGSIALPPRLPFVKARTQALGFDMACEDAVGALPLHTCRIEAKWPAAQRVSLHLAGLFERHQDLGANLICSFRLKTSGRREDFLLVRVYKIRCLSPMRRRLELLSETFTIV